MSRSRYAETIERELGPHLGAIGFTLVNLKDCMRPEVLLRRGDLWFGTSWDWRDRYLEVSLGDLVWLKDVMPRVIVLGRYENYCPELRKLDLSTGDLGSKVASLVAGTITSAVAMRASRPGGDATESSRLAAHIIGPANDSDLRQYVV